MDLKGKEKLIAPSGRLYLQWACALGGQKRRIMTEVCFYVSVRTLIKADILWQKEQHKDIKQE